MKLFLYSCVFFLFLSSCSKDEKLPPIDNQVDLDGTTVNDSSIAFPERFLLSQKIPNPTSIELSKPVVICVHGFSASTFEWIEFRDMCSKLGTVNTSLVLLGGHGTNYADFKKSTWEDWQQPILEEYAKLVGLGYTNISLAGSSTGAPLLLNALYENKITTSILKHVFLIDPIVVPSNKTLSLVKVVGPLLNYSETTFTPGEIGFWYKYRPYQALDQLNQITKKVRKELEHGITLPSGINLTVFKSEHDDAADPVSAVLIEKGIQVQNDSKMKVEMIASDLHVYTRLAGRTVVSEIDMLNQKNTFEAIVKKITN